MNSKVVCAALLAACAVIVAFAMLAGPATATQEFNRERRTQAEAAAALESLRMTLATQDNALFEIASAVRNVAKQSDVIAVGERAVYLTSYIEDLASDEDVSDMNNAVLSTVQAANAATILTEQIGGALPPLRSRAEVALTTSLSLLQQFASHEVAVVSFEEAYRAEKAELLASRSTLENSASEFFEATNFTSTTNDIIARSDVLIDFVQDIDTETFATVLSNMRLTSAYDSSVPVFYWRSWLTYSHYQGWFAGNNAGLFGGVNPSEWSDGNGYAYELSQNMEVLKGFFNQKMVTGFSAHVWSQEWYYYSSTNAQHTGVIFRIRNTQSSTITWSVRVYHHNYGSWSEASSAAMNGVNHWTNTNSCGSCSSQVNFNVPANGISTIIYITSSSQPSSTRASGMAFYDDTLRLPDGLEWVDDLPTAKSLFEADE